ncbi:hypothetical protein DE146DRAFT_635250 [Phaeosphaeria sp. MPI-PUGE-AT-0046c]|nr:hypothetical protein DE146DRAFT_635250 [Phaeosphaeria sp. MPI-PUGE-AT-0046c]
MLRNSWLLLLCVLAAVSAAFNLDGVEEYIHHGVKRQASGTGNGNASPTNPPPSSAAPTTTPRPSQNPPTSNNPPPTSDAPQPSSQAPPPSSRNQGTPTARSTPGSAPQSTPPAESVAPSSIVIRTSPLVSTSLAPFTVTRTSTLSNGQVSEVTETGTSSVPITTGSLQYTDLPTSQKGDGGSGSGLSESNKKVIGGVVGGIGGALLLGGIALVFWRMKKRQNKVTVDDDDLTINTGAALGDKPQNGHGPSPFQSNLEQYHNPGGRPNAAANF